MLDYPFLSTLVQRRGTTGNHPHRQAELLKDPCSPSSCSCRLLEFLQSEDCDEVKYPDRALKYRRRLQNPNLPRQMVSVPLLPPHLTPHPLLPVKIVYAWALMGRLDSAVLRDLGFPVFSAVELRSARYHFRSGMVARQVQSGMGRSVVYGFELCSP